METVWPSVLKRRRQGRGIQHSMSRMYVVSGRPFTKDGLLFICNRERKRGDNLQEQMISKFQSRRNNVQLIKTNAGKVVQKSYSQKEDCSRELKIYKMLRGTSVPHAHVTDCDSMWIEMTYLPGENLVDILDGQEQSGIIRWTIWEKLVKWLLCFHETTGHVMTDVNLRNFLYDPGSDVLYGVDFEACEEGSMTRTAALLAAYIRHYAPENTRIKQEIAEYVLKEFSRCLSIPMQELLMETEKQEAFLRERRKKKE